MGLSTEYRGYVISYSENGDVWNCFDCKVEASTLGKAKAKIDALHLKMRKASAVDAFELVTNYGKPPELEDCKIIDYVRAVHDHNWMTSAPPRLVDHEVASMAHRRGSERKSRRNVKLSGIIKPGPETDAAFDEAVRLWRIFYDADQAFKAAIEAIPRLTLADIDGLVTASKAKIEEDDD